MDQQSLHRVLCSFDVGLAIEPGKDYNNIIAWSNKLLAYFQSGLFILASDTPAHKDFFSRFPENGMALPLHSNGALSSVNQLLSMVKKIKEEKQKRRAVSQAQSWEKEAGKILEIWDEVNNLPSAKPGSH